MSRHVVWPTEEGLLRGIDANGVVRYLGVRYGADTSGANRFRAPGPVEPWRGTRDAFAYGPAAPQVDTRLLATGSTPAVLELMYPRSGSPVEGGPMNEDCLRVNVWAPSGATPGSLPVVLWLHGGAFVHGSGNEQMFAGDVLAATENVVVVSVTHRLGALGFLDLRGYGFADSANAGMLDIVAALEWVHRNIAGVGGDPSSITVAGQSGGAAKAATLTTMPAATPFIRRAMIMSFPISRISEPDQSGRLAERLLELVGSRADQLQDEPLDVLLEAQRAVLALAGEHFGAEWDPDALLPGFGPSLDPHALPRHPFWPDAAPAFRDMDLVFGSTAHEFALMLADDPDFTPEMSSPVARDRLGSTKFEELATQHPGEPPHLLLARGLSDRYFRMPILDIASRAAAQGATPYVYVFDQTTEVLGGLLGASHSLDLAYFFGTIDRIPVTGRDPSRHAVAAESMRVVGTFARDGVPQGPTGDWSRWDGASDVNRLGSSAHTPIRADVPGH